MARTFGTVMGAAVLIAAAGIFFAACQDAHPPAAAAISPTDESPAPEFPPVDSPADRALRKANKGKYLFENQIQPGMTGYGLTVMSGGKIQRFNVTVIDVIKDFSPGDNAILVRCSGLGLEHSGIIAGMSGSPVYIKGKMIGAIAYGWGMSKDPVAGVQPIRQMLAIANRPSEIRSAQNGGGPGGAIWTAAGPFARQASTMPGWRHLTAALARRAGANNLDAPRAPHPTASHQWRNLDSPLMVSGLSAASLNLLQQGLAGTGLVAVASGQGGSGTATSGQQLGGIAQLSPGEITLTPGAAIAVPLLTGDMDMAAIGTVTEVTGDRVFAFGHAFLAQGQTSLPMATGYIYTVMANLNQSFKMGASMKAAGTLVMDEQTGIMGVEGAAPATVPVTITVQSGSAPAKIYHYQLSPHPKLTPIILNTMLTETLTATRALPPQFTARITGEVTFAPLSTGPHTGQALPVKITNVGSTDSFQAAAALLPIIVLTDNPFDDLRMTSLNLTATIEPVNHGGVIRSVHLDRLSVAPGDEIHAVAEVQRYQQDIVRVPITVRVPADAPDGDYALSVGAPAMALEEEAEYAPQRFDPQNIQALKAAVDRIEHYSADHLYATLVMNLSGAAVGGREMADLPASRVMIYASDRRTDAAPVMRVVRQEVDAGVILESGGQHFVVHVNRKADDRYFSGKGGARGESGAREPGGNVLNREPPASEPDGD